jgi:DNA-directed RNA polymerase specialized sigma24 family protein
MARDAKAEVSRWPWNSGVLHGKAAGADDSGSHGDAGRLHRAAQRIRRRVTQYTARHLGDGLRGEEILEDVLQSAVLAEERSEICSPEGYLFSGVVRRVKQLLARTPEIDYRGSVWDLDRLRTSRANDWTRAFEDELLAKEMISLLDAETRRIHRKKAMGDSWDEIGADLGISAEAARKRFAYGIQKLKERIADSGGIESRPAPAKIRND